MKKNLWQSILLNSCHWACKKKLDSSAPLPTPHYLNKAASEYNIKNFKQLTCSLKKKWLTTSSFVKILQDTALISVANILHRSGYLNDAIVATNMALDVPVKLVVSHFTMANLYAAKARSFYSGSLLNIKLKFIIKNVYLIMQLCLRNNYMW